LQDKQLKPKTQELKKGEPSEEECSPSASLNGIWVFITLCMCLHACMHLCVCICMLTLKHLHAKLWQIHYCFWLVIIQKLTKKLHWYLTACTHRCFVWVRFPVWTISFEIYSNCCSAICAYWELNPCHTATVHSHATLSTLPTELVLARKPKNRLCF
jgi:hypothetical protein